MMKTTRLLPVSVMVTVTLVLGVGNSAGTTILRPAMSHVLNTTTMTTTTDRPAVNLEQKMFTMAYGGGISFSSPHTASIISSVSVCLRYITDYMQQSTPQIFTLSPSTSPLKLVDQGRNTYVLSSGYGDVYSYLAPNVYVWSLLKPEVWTRFCVTVDTRRNVVQAFRDSDMSIRKLLSKRYVWSGEPVLDFAGFDGQLTDVQVWDYPLSHSEVYNYMSGGAFGRYHGSTLSWSSITYTLRGNTLLEDVYGQQVEESLSGSKAGRQMGEKIMKFVDEGESL